MKTAALGALVVALVAVAWSSSSGSAAVEAWPAALDATPAQQLQQARAGTQRFKLVAAAKLAGYKQSTPCIDGKGIHFRNMKHYREPGVFPGRPEMLLYEPTAKGLVLVGLEYEHADSDQRYETTKDRPKLFGKPFQGPLAAHPTGPQKIHYHLHVWAWKPNRSGLVSELHSNVSCG